MGGEGNDVVYHLAHIIPIKPVQRRWRLSDDKYWAEKNENSIFDHLGSLAAQTSLEPKEPCVAPAAELGAKGVYSSNGQLEPRHAKNGPHQGSRDCRID